MKVKREYYMVTIRRYWNMGEAGFVRSLLEAAGIEAVIPDECVGTMGSPYLPGGIRVQVPEGDEQRAMEVLDQEACMDTEPPALPTDASVPLEHEVGEPMDASKMERLEIPGLLELVTTVFFLEGILAVIGMLFRFRSDHMVDLGVLLIPTSFGLLRFSRGWRVFALIGVWIDLILCPLALIPGATIHTPGDQVIVFGTSLADNSPPLRVAAFVAFALAIWKYRVLTRPAIRALFEAQRG